MESKNQPIIKGIHLGDRKDDFKNFLKQIFENAHINNEHIAYMLKKENFKKFSSAFTCESIDVKNNYEYLEHIGDGFYNAFFVSYIYETFPKLQSSDYVKIVARLKINYASKNVLANIAENNGFWKFISTNLNARQTQKKKLLEDTFEAFIGCVVQIMDTYKNDFDVSMGAPTVKKILYSFFSKLTFSFKYEDLYDSITRLKELRDMLPKDVGTLETVFDHKDNLVVCEIRRTTKGAYNSRPDGTPDYNKLIRGTGKTERLCFGKGSLQSNAEQAASEIAITELGKEGLIKHPPHIYTTLNEENHVTNEKDVFRICSPSTINDQIQIKGKKNKYTCTPIFHFFQSEDIEGIRICLDKGADPNIPDCYGLTPFDCILIKRNESLFRTIWKMCNERNIELEVHENIKNFFTNKEGINKLVKVLKDF